jgi:lysophospholipase L1-like esterase
MRQILGTRGATKRAVVAAASAAAVCASVLVAASPPARAASPPPAAAGGWYLALGDSVAAGYQPTTNDNPTGGYVGYVLQALQQQRPTTKTQLRNLACDHETSTTFTVGGSCTYEEGSQLSQALVFLRAHASTTRLVTVTLGGNDVTPCLPQPNPQSCTQQALSGLATRLAAALAEVHAAAPSAQIVVTNYYNPYLAAWFTNPALATLSTTLQSALNGTIASAAASAGASTADVASAFKSTDTTLVNGVPTNVLTICQLTWMCTSNNDHPNDAGYAVIGAAIVAQVN